MSDTKPTTVITGPSLKPPGSKVIPNTTTTTSKPTSPNPPKGTK